MRRARIRWTWRAWLCPRRRWHRTPRNFCVVYRRIFALGGLSACLYLGARFTRNPGGLRLAAPLVFGAVYFVALALFAPDPGAETGKPASSGTSRTK